MMQLNKHLQPIGSPVDTKGTISTASEFGIRNKRNSITASRIKSIDLTASSGGTVNISGTASNIDRIEIFNNTGKELGQIDNNGFTLFGSTSLQYYDTSLGTYIASFGPQGGTAFMQSHGTFPLYIKGNIDLSQGTLNNTTINNGVFGAPNVTGGTLNPSVYQNGAGSIGIGTVLTYIKTGTIQGTLTFSNGILIQSQ